MSYADAYEELGGVAIVSLAGRFPGARDVEELWENLVAGRETISRFEESELEPANRFDMENRRDPSYVRARGILEDVELFDAEFFRMSPREAEVTDPQQRLFLEASWEALERAGYDPESYDGAIGVYAGMSNNTYFLANLHSRPDVLAQAGELPMLGNEKDYLATRVSYKLNLNGPGINVATACSTSLVAVCQAVQGLLTHQCDLALAGGVSISVPQRRGYLHQDGFITSPDGHCRAFDERAAGTVFSNGLGIVVLKRLEDALEDGDGIFAVIRGTAVTNDGSARVSFTAPSVDGQADAIAMAQALAGIDPGTIGYVEAHGTGTALGDPIEVAALTQAFRLETDASGYCALGSVKTNIGHLDAAAGVTGLIKVALALRHATIPPTLHFQAPNPKLNLPGTPFFVNTEVMSWPDLATPRRAGVSSLGAGGTNAHVVLEEAPPAPATDEARSEQLIVLSARSEPALRRMTERLRARLGADDDLALADVAYTLQAGRRRFEHRRAFVATSREDALELLESGDPTRVISEVQDAQGSSIAFMFPGQGAQRVNMGRELYESEPVFRTEVDECAEILRPVLDIDLRSLLYPRDGDIAEAEFQLSRTAITQPAVFVTSYALARLWKRWGVEPDVMIGHSLGEYVAACLAGVFSREDALTLVARRALLMQELPPGAMLAVRATVEELADVLVPELAVASLNAPRLNVLSGTPATVEFAADQLRERRIAARPLATSHAFHSPMMESILGRFEEIVNQVPCHAPAIPFVSSVTGDWIDQATATDPKYWARQVREPVRFGEGAARLLDDPGRVYVEVGPGQTLVTLLRQQSTGASALATIASLGGGQSSAVESMLAAAGRLWSAGVDLDWSGVHSHGRRKRVLLPTYPFERKRYWVEPQPAATGASDSTAGAHASHPTLPESSTRAHEEDSNEMAFGAPIPQPTTDVSARLRALFSELSGLDESQLQPTAAFLDLGLDSLFLTQARTMVQKTFGVKVPFRDLLGDASTLAALAARIESQLPADALVEQQSLPTPATQAPLVKANVDLAHAADGLLEQVIREQMALMSRQLDMLRDAGADSPRSAPAPVEPVSQPRLNGAPDGSAASVSRQGGATPRVAFGPYRPPARGASAGLTRRQSDALEALVDRYVRRTATSRRFTDENRGHLADPRSVAGFRLSWKEMVYPIVTTRSSGSKLWDLDGNEYVDLTNGFGTILFGHNPPFISEALEAQLRQGIEIGPQTPLAGDVSRQVSEMTGMERVAFCNTGSEAVTAAIRVARAVSGRDTIAMFEGAYHGIFDEVLVRAGKVAGRQRSVPIAPGIPSSMAENILVLEYGAPESLAVLKARAPELAAVLVEPVQSRHPELQPVDFLRELRTITEQSEVALVFDEVVSGFRAHPGGAQALFGIRADIATYGKVAGGGLPIGLVAGQGAYMDALDGGAWSYGDDSLPEVGVTFFAGTFVRHPLALAAARAVLGKLKEEGPELQRTLNIRTTQLVDELNEHAERMGAPVRVTHFASWFCFNFPADVPYASLFYAYMRHKGIHVWEGRAGFLTTAHTDEDIARVLSAFRDTISEMQAAEFLPGSADPPVPGALRGQDEEGQLAWFLPDGNRPGKYLLIGEGAEARG